MAVFKERRECVRKKYKTAVSISTVFNETKIRAELQNISILGMYATTTQKLDVGSKCQVQIAIDGSHSRLLVEDIEAKVIRQDDGGIGFRFVSNMEWFLLFTTYSHYENNGDSASGTGTERRQGMFDRRASAQDRRRGEKDRRKA